MKFDCRKYGMIPFWFWNGMQNESEISRQMELAKAGGLRGLAVHARKGNKIEYMSERWLTLLRHTCMKARSLGLEIWLYDEEGFPSGTAGERLPRRGQEYQQKALTFKYINAREAATDPMLVKAFAADDLSQSVNPVDLHPESMVLVFSKFFISDYIDALNRKVLDEFLKITHEIYWAKIPEFFGNPITAFYTDDLNHLLIYGRDIPYLSYTDSLEDTFQKKCGYSILENLPALVENIPGCEKIRFDYRQTVMHMFLDNYVMPMHDWCKMHGALPLTGHLSGDEGPMLKSICRFGSAMPFYDCEDIPGIDDYLAARRDNSYMGTAFNDLGFSMIILCKQVSSVANQLKQGICSSEVLTSLGWGVPVEQQLAQIRFQQGLGINLIIPHDYSYSTAGVTKRDHPASYFFQQPWYHENKEIHDSVARSFQLISRGRCAAKIAVLNPVESGWIALDGERLSPGFTCKKKGMLSDTDFIEKKFAELSLMLLKRHIDFEYIDEDLLAKYGNVENASLKLGHASYDILILPEVISMRASTFELLKAFSAASGKIILTGEKPVFINGLIEKTFFDLPCISEKDWINLLEPSLDFSADKNHEEILLHSRTVNGNLEYFLTNFSPEKTSLQINSDMTNYVLYDPQTDKVINDKVPAFFSLQPLACCHIIPHGIIESETADISETLFSPHLPSTASREISYKITVCPENENFLLLDSGFLDDEKKMFFNINRDIPSGTRITIPIDIPDPKKISHIYGENMESLKMTVNEKNLNNTDQIQHPATPDLHGISLAGLLHKGRNSIVIISPGGRIENLYLCGTFGVKLNAATSELIETSLGLGDASAQGLPFYWGTLLYTMTFSLNDISEIYWLDLGNIDGIVRIKVNEFDLGLRFQSPMIFRLKGLRQGENEINIRLYNTAQNFFGPHRKENILGKDRSSEGSSLTAWTPEIEGDSPFSWGCAPFGIYGPIKLSS